jgi:nucleotide-binding universal stress UspA family protein
MFRTILVPLDGSDHSTRALDAAIQIAKKFEAKITLIHVYQSTYPLFASEPGFIPPVNAEWIDTLQKNGQAILAAGKQQVTSEGIHVETVLKEGHVVTEILDIAEQGQFDLIVIGARGLSPLKELFLGSVSHGVTTHTQRPVLIVK